MKVRHIIVLLLALLVAAGAGWSRVRARQAADAVTTLYGNVDIREVTLAFRVGGRVRQVRADEGQRVAKGTVLALLDDAPLRNNLDAAEAALSAAEARNRIYHQGYREEDIRQARARRDGAQAALTEAEQQLVRQTALLPDGGTDRKTLDAARATRDVARAQLAAASAQLEALRHGYRKDEIRESDGLLAAARAQVAAARLALSDAGLTAPEDGVVLTRSIEPGSLVQAGTPALVLSLPKPVRLRAYVSEPQLGLFGTGTAVLIESDSRPGEPYHGTIGYVSPTAEFTPRQVETPELRTSLVYRVRIEVRDADGRLRQGMPVTIRRAGP